MESEKEVTRKGNPACPEGDYGFKMLERMNESHEEVTNWGLEKLILDNPSRILDIGCGGGATMARLASRYPEAVIHGLDYSKVSVLKSSEFNRAAIEEGKMAVIQASVDSIPYEDDYFDGITTVESFYFWPSHLENMKEVLRVLKPEGTFVIIADLYDDGSITDGAMEAIREYNMFVPGPEELEELFLEAGFKDIQVITVEGKPWILAKGRK